MTRRTRKGRAVRHPRCRAEEGGRGINRSLAEWSVPGCLPAQDEYDAAVLWLARAVGGRQRPALARGAVADLDARDAVADQPCCDRTGAALRQACVLDRGAERVPGVVGITGHPFGRRDSAAEVPPLACSDGIVLRGMRETDTDSRAARGADGPARCTLSLGFGPRIRGWREAVEGVTMLFASGSGNAGPCRRLVAELVPAVRAVGSVALVCAAAACLRPRRQPVRRPATRGCRRRPNRRPAIDGCRPRHRDGQPCEPGPLGGMDEAVEGHREGRW